MSCSHFLLLSLLLLPLLAISEDPSTRPSATSISAQSSQSSGLQIINPVFPGPKPPSSSSSSTLSLVPYNGCKDDPECVDRNKNSHNVPCKAYIPRKDGELDVCNDHCGGKVNQAVGCNAGSSGPPPVYTDPDGSKYNPGVCVCDIKFADWIWHEVAIALPIIADFACQLLFNAFDDILQLGMEAVPGLDAVETANLGMRIAVTGARAIDAKGLGTSAFSGWIGSSVCGINKYTAEVDEIFPPLIGRPGRGGKRPPKGPKHNPKPKPTKEPDPNHSDEPKPTDAKPSDAKTSDDRPTKTTSDTKTGSTTASSTTSGPACGLQKRAGSTGTWTECMSGTTHVTIVSSMKFGSQIKTFPQTCSSSYSQACYNYRSIVSRHPEFAELTCSDELGTTTRSHADSPATTTWLTQHGGNDNKIKWLEGARERRCDMDEYPPSYFMQEQWVEKQRMRLLPATDNRRAGQLWSRFCYNRGLEGVDKDDKLITRPVSSSTTKNINTGGDKKSEFLALDVIRSFQARSTISKMLADSTLCLATTKITTYLQVSVPVKPVFTIAEYQVPNDNDDGLEANECWPREFAPRDAGYVLMTNDEWYNNRPPPYDYKKPPPPRPSSPSGSKARRVVGDILDDMAGHVNRTFEA